jgi:predicted GNAT family acetyltransferase
LISAAMPFDGRVDITRNDDAGRYELRLDGQRVGLADFYERDGVVVIPHTETLPAFGGQGLASQLIRFALDDIAARSKKVDPVCPFVAVFIRRNPAYADLLA